MIVAVSLLVNLTVAFSTYYILDKVFDIKRKRKRKENENENENLIENEN